MQITPKTSLRDLLEEHPQARDVLSWYGIEDVEDMDDKLRDICEDWDIDYEDLEADLLSYCADEEEDEKDDEEEEWEENFEDDEDEYESDGDGDSEYEDLDEDEDEEPMDEDEGV